MRPISIGSIHGGCAESCGVEGFDLHRIRVDGRQSRARPDIDGTPVSVLFSHLLGARRGSDPGQRVREQLPALWTDSVWFWSLAHCVTFNLPVPVRVLWQDFARIYFGSLMSLRANAPLDEATTA